MRLVWPALGLDHHVLDNEAKLLHQQRAKDETTQAIAKNGIDFEVDELVPAKATGGLVHQALQVRGDHLFKWIDAVNGDHSDVLP
mgnify:CR=1 FL=1